MSQSQNNSTSIVSIPFKGQTIEARANGNSYYIILRHVCQNLGIDYTAQYERLKRRPWATVVILTTVGSDNRKRQMAAIDRRTFLMWLATISVNMMKNKRARLLVIAYQKKAADVLDHFFGKQFDEAARKNQQEVVQLRSQLNRQKGAVAVAYEMGVDVEGSNATQVAALLQQRGVKTGRNRLIKWCISRKLMYRLGGRPWPYQKYIQKGYFTFKRLPVKDKRGVVHSRMTVLFTTKGVGFVFKQQVPQTLEITK